MRKISHIIHFIFQSFSGETFKKTYFVHSSLQFLCVFKQMNFILICLKQKLISSLVEMKTFLESPKSLMLVWLNAKVSSLGGEIQELQQITHAQHHCFVWVYYSLFVWDVLFLCFTLFSALVSFSLFPCSSSFYYFDNMSCHYCKKLCCSLSYRENPGRGFCRVRLSTTGVQFCNAIKQLEMISESLFLFCDTCATSTGCLDVTRAKYWSFISDEIVDTLFNDK